MSSLHGQSFFKPHELVARHRKERTGNYLCNINRVDAILLKFF
jgi:hypothetical protein